MTQQIINTDTIAKLPKKNRAIHTPIDGFIQAVSLRISTRRAKEVERFIKFAMVGTLGAIVDFGTLNILQSTILPPVDALGHTIGFDLSIGQNSIFIPTHVALAATISFIAAITSNFFWNRFWTYPDSRSRSVRRQLAQFATVSVIGWSARTAWISASFHAIGTIAVSTLNAFITPPITDSELTARIGSNIALFIGIFVVMIWNFFANRYWTYNDVD